jgi:hypothetical protein
LSYIRTSVPAFNQLERNLAVRVAIASAGAARQGHSVRHWVLRQLSMLLA